MARRGYDPLAPLRPGQLRKQARAYISAQIDPLIQQVNQDFSRREASNQHAIGDFTNQLQQRLAPLAGQTAGYYQQAETQERTLNDLLANRLNSVGGQEAAALQQRLASAGLPTDQAQRVSAVASGAANTSAALGSANLSQLLASGAAQTSYAGRLPGIAALGGLQYAKQNLAQLEQQRGQQLSSLRSRVPGLVSSELNQLQNLEFQKATANLGFAGTQAKLGAQIASSNARLATTQRGQNLSHQDRQAALQVRQQQAQATAAAKQKATNQKRTNAFYSIRSKTFAAAKTLAAGTSGQPSSGGGYQPPSAGGANRPDYGTAYRRLFGAYGVPLMRQYNFKRSAVDQMIRRALSNAGYENPKKAAAAGAAAASAAVGSLGLY